MPFKPGESGNPSGRRPGENKARRAILRALARRGGDVARGLDLAADELVKLAVAGESWAQRELYDRVDGKPKQAQEITGPGGGPVAIKTIERVIVDPKAED